MGTPSSRRAKQEIIAATKSSKTEKKKHSFALWSFLLLVALFCLGGLSYARFHALLLASRPNPSTGGGDDRPRSEEARGGGGGEGEGPEGRYHLYLEAVPAPGSWPSPLNDQWPSRNDLHRSGGDTSRDHRVTLTTCIPALAPRWRDDLPRVLESVRDQTDPADEVVVVISSVLSVLKERSVFERWDGEGKAWCRDVYDEARKILDLPTSGSASASAISSRPSIPLKVICLGERLTAGWARNVLSRTASQSSEILSYIDADDAEYPVRNEVIRNLFGSNCYGGQLSLLLHSATFPDDVHPYEKQRMGIIMADGTRQVKGRPLFGVPPDRSCSDEEHMLPVFYGDALSDRLKTTYGRMWLYTWVAHGHMVVHRRVFEHVRFTDAIKGEDCMFVRDVIRTYGPHRNATMYLIRPLTYVTGRGLANLDLLNATTV